MPEVKLRVSRWLRQSLDSESSDANDILVGVREGESVLDTIRRLTGENHLFWKHIFDEKTQEITSNVLVTVNGRIVNPYDRSQTTLKDGDEVTFLDLVDGG